MELAHHMKDLKTQVGVDFVFFDGEEYIFKPKRDLYFFGSKHFAKAYQKGKPPYQYVAALLFDMIGGKDARFPAEGYSIRRARPLVEEVWAVARELKCDAFLNKVSDYEVQDDHLALLDAGIPAIDIIDFEYKHWHRLTDTPENCSAASLAQVSRVVTVWLQRVK
jgi:glutaminyl-peptide cyclotransferase